MRVWVLLVVVAAAEVFGGDLTGTVYERESNREKALFHWKRVEKKEGAWLDVTLTYSTPEGAEAVVERVRFEAGRVTAYSIDHKQTGETGRLEAKDGKLTFEYTRDGKTKTDVEDVPENLVLTSTLTDFLAGQRERLLKGETVSARLGVLDRRETVGFKFFKTSEGLVDGVETVVIKMKPTSFIISAIVDPLYLTFSKEGMRVLEIDGRTMPKRLVNGKWKDLDALTVYH